MKNIVSRDVNGLKKKKKEIHDKTMKFENYATLTSVYILLFVLTTNTFDCWLYYLPSFLQIRVTLTLSFGGR